jgi:histidinol-phosphatase (PHP family)
LNRSARISSSPNGIDYHIHTNHSVDARGAVHEYCEQAQKLRLRELCFTNHCELDAFRNDNVIRFGNVQQPLTREGLRKMQREVLRAKELYKRSGLTIKFGLEVGYYEGIESRLQEITDGIDFDFMLGSIHCLDHICIDSSRECAQYFSQYSVKDMLLNYYRAIEALIDSQLFDSIGHLDVYKKYGRDFYGTEIHTFPEQYLIKIFSMMVEKKIALEVNAAGYRQFNEFYPSPTLMKCARQHGISMITIGSDCHKVEDLSGGIKEALEYARSFGFDAVYTFDKRKSVKIKIEKPQ